MPKNIKAIKLDLPLVKQDNYSDIDKESSIKSDIYHYETDRKNTLKCNGDYYSKDIKEFESFIIVNPYSINKPELYFTNHLSRKQDSKKIKILQDIYSDLKLSQLNLNELFVHRELEEITRADKQKLSRLINILKENKSDYLSIRGITKWKYKNFPAVQLYIDSFSDDKIKKIVLIDVHHLGIFAKNCYFKNIKESYNTHKNKSYCISKILKLEKLLEDGRVMSYFSKEENNNIEENKEES